MKQTRKMFWLISEPIVSKRFIAAVGVGVVVGAVAGLGFTAAGVAAGSTAASIQVLTCTIIIIVYGWMTAMLQ